MRDEGSTGSRAARLVAVPLLLMASAAFSIGGAELVLRWLGPADFRRPPAALEVYGPHPLLGWAHRPNTRVRIDEGEYHATVEINSQGLRDREYSYSKPAGTRRLLVLGDSFADAIQVEQHYTFHALLEDDLEHELGRASLEVLNGGVDAWGTDQEVLFYEIEGHRYDPDLVLLFFTLSNDARDVSSELIYRDRGRLRLKPYYRLAGGELVLDLFPREEPFLGIYESRVRHHSVYAARPTAWETTTGVLYRYSRLFQWLHVRWLERQNWGRGADRIHPALDVYRREPHPLWDQAWEVTRAFLTRLDAETRRRGARLAVFFVLDPRSVDESALDTYLDEHPDAAILDWDLPRQRLTAMLEALGIPFLDPREAFVREATRRPGTLYFPRNRHWTIEGHRFVADLIYDWLATEEELGSSLPRRGVSASPPSDGGAGSTACRSRWRGPA